MNKLRSEIEDFTAEPLQGLDLLEVGYGQSRLALAFFAAIGNNTTGIDLDATPAQRWDLLGWAAVLRRNGTKRFLKSVIREVSGFDRAVRKEFVKALALRRWPKFNTFQMNANTMTFRDTSFDFVYSYDTFEHISTPEKALNEIRRVLRPGGTAWITFVTFTYHNALHDIRVILNNSDAPQPWAHLVPSLAKTVQQGAYINGLRLHEWKDIVNSSWPGSTFSFEGISSEHELILTKLRKGGHLRDYTDEELMCNHVTVKWKKKS